MSGARWRCLVADLAAAGVAITLDEMAYSEDRHGRVVHAVSRSITLRLGDAGALLGVHDKWSRYGGHWMGWQVHVENADGIVTHSWPFAKERAEVVAAVLEAKAAQVA